MQAWGGGLERGTGVQAEPLRLGDKSRWKQQLCVHVGSAADKWAEEPCLGQCVETVARLAPRWMEITVFCRVFSESTWPWHPPLLFSMVFDGFLTARPG